MSDMERIIAHANAKLATLAGRLAREAELAIEMDLPPRMATNKILDEIRHYQEFKTWASGYLYF